MHVQVCVSQEGARGCVQMGKHRGVCAVVSAGKKMAGLWGGGGVCKCTHNIIQAYVTQRLTERRFSIQKSIFK